MATKKISKKTSTKKTTKPVVQKAVRKVTKKTVNKIAKKVVAKKVPKKPATKKVVNKKVVVRKKTKPAKKPLVYAADHKSFWTTNGEVLNSLLALRDALEAMEHEVYDYHARGVHNDFADWVSDVLCDGNCAVELKRAKTPRSAKTVIIRHLKAYSN